MTSRLLGRIAQLEAAGKGAPSYVVILPPDAMDAPAAQAAAIAAHRERTGYTGPVILAPRECGSVEEWGRLAAAPDHGTDGGA